MFKRASWLSLTPEPERVLPEVVATLEAGPHPPSERVSHERQRIEQLILHSGERAWLSYLEDVRRLIERRADVTDGEMIAARTRAATVLANHHNLLLGLPGKAATRTAGERARMAAILATIPTATDQKDAPR
jgi:hypothetical protein